MLPLLTRIVIDCISVFLHMLKWAVRKYCSLVIAPWWSVAGIIPSKKRFVLLNKRGLATLANEFRSGLDAAPTRPTLQHFVVRKDKRQVLKNLNNVPKKTNGSKRNTGRQQHDNIVCDMPPAWGDIPEGTDARTFFLHYVTLIGQGHRIHA